MTVNSFHQLLRKLRDDLHLSVDGEIVYPKEVSTCNVNSIG